MTVGEREVEVARWFNSAFGRVDFVAVRDALEGGDPAALAEDENVAPLYERMSEVLDPNIEVEFRTAQMVERRRYVGLEAWVELWRTWLEAWDEYRITSSNYETIGDHVVADVVQRGLGRGSGLEVELTQAQVWTFRDGVVVACRVYDTREDAMEDIGVDA